MVDSESPDHAGLRADALNVAHEVTRYNVTSTYQALPFIIQFGVNVFAKGVASQSAELATLRGAHSRCDFRLKVLRGIRSRFLEITQTQSVPEAQTAIFKLQTDNAELQKEVNALAGQVQGLTAQQVLYAQLYKKEEARADNYMNWIEQRTCNCLKPPPSIIHKGDCMFSAILRELEPVEAK